MQDVVVVGGGLAAHRAVKAARATGFDGTLTVLSAEHHMPYDRPPLSKQLLSPTEDTARHFYDSDGLTDVTWKLGDAAAALDVDRRVVTTASGSTYSYDALLIATGKRARPLPMAVPTHGVHTIRDLGDALAVRDAVSARSRVVIIGGGFIGCEAASSLLDLGVAEVTVVEVAPRPMAVLGEEVGDVALDMLQSSGVRCRFGQTVMSVDGTDAVAGVTLSSGERIAADLLLVSIGSVPNTEWLADSGLELLRGHVACDEYCFAAGGDARVVAAGDVAAWRHPYVGMVAIEHWAIARDMGAAAIGNVLYPDARTAMSTVPTFWSDQFGVKIKSAGFVGLAERISIVERDPAKKSLIAEAYRGDELIGVVVVNRNRAIIDYQRTLAGRIDSARATGAVS